MDEENLDQQPVADEHLEQAYALEDQGDYHQALAECDAAIELGRAFLAGAYNLRGIILEGLERSEEALDAHNTALEFVPGFEDALENLEGLRADLGISDDLVTLLTFGSAVEAHLAKGRLEMEGIESFVADEYAAATFGLSQTDGIRLQVRESDMGRALEIMGIEDDDEQDEQDEQDEEQEVTCPRCGSDDVRPPFLGQEWRCKACGHRWVL